MIIWVFKVCNCYFDWAISDCVWAYICCKDLIIVIVYVWYSDFFVYVYVKVIVEVIVFGFDGEEE